MPKPLTVDPKVHELAAGWLSDDASASAKDRTEHDARVRSLARDIQVAIEGWQEDEARAAEEQAEQDAEMRATGGRSI
jgi:hypothetical protein